MTNSHFIKTKEIEPLHSTALQGTSFNRLAHGITGYSGPMLMLIRHRYETEKEGTQNGIIGAFMTGGVLEDVDYQGDHGSYLFQIKPNMGFFYAYNGDGEKNYYYVNPRKIQNSKFIQGMGFGGKDYKSWRLWIDNEVNSLSTSYYKDGTYGFGSFNEGTNEYLHV